MKKITCVSDFVADDLAYHELITAIDGYSKTPKNLRISRVLSQTSTIHTGYLVEQIAYTEERLGRPSESIIFANTDPRIYASGSDRAAHGAEFMITKLSSGLYVCGPNAGHSLSFIKKKIETVSRYVNFETTSVSRSRDLFSRVIAHLADYMEDELDLEEVHLSTIPDIPDDNLVLSVDNFHNITTNISQENASERHNFGNFIKVNIGSEVHEVRFVTHRFAGTAGEIVIYPGSHGHPDNPYMEISVWQEYFASSTKKKMPFANAAPGDVILIK